MLLNTLRSSNYRIANSNNNFYMDSDYLFSLESSIKKILRIINEQFLLCKNNQRNNILELFTVDTILWCCNFGLT